MILGSTEIILRDSPLLWSRKKLLRLKHTWYNSTRDLKYRRGGRSVKIVLSKMLPKYRYVCILYRAITIWNKLFKFTIKSFILLANRTSYFNKQISDKIHRVGNTGPRAWPPSLLVEEQVDGNFPSETRMRSRAFCF